MDDLSKLGPLEALVGAWEGEGGDEIDPFHTEIGYWLGDEAEGQVRRAVSIPRGSVIVAGGAATADSTSFTMTADCGSEEYGILSNRYLATNARCSRYEVTVTVEGDTYTYDEDTVLDMAGHDEPLHHTDRNVLHRVESA